MINGEHMEHFEEIAANSKSLRQRKPLFGVGINDASYIVRVEVNGKFIVCPFYVRWTKMLERCYSEKYQLRMPTYINCSVCDEWLIFSNFKLWMQGQDWRGNELDKDLLVQGNKIYSPERCLFVPSQVNTLLLDCGSRKGKYPQGVYFDKVRGLYSTTASVSGRNKFLGRFATPEEASNAYKLAKYKIIKDVALSQPEPIKSALLKFKIP